MLEPSTTTTNNISSFLEYLEQVIAARLIAHFSEEKHEFILNDIPIPATIEDGSELAQFLIQEQLPPAEHLTLLLTIIPHINPAFLNNTFSKYLPKSGDFSELGGVKDDQSRGFLPTGETALFLIAGSDIDTRTKALDLFGPEHKFYKKRIVILDTVKKGIPKTRGRLILDSEYAELFLTNKITPPVLSAEFPAQRLQTQQDWDDLVLPKHTFAQLEELKIWVKHHRTLMQDWGMVRKLKPGYSALFHGPPGTGKTLTATLIGKQTGRDVFRIDLSTVVSKFIGETEKNLSTLFDKAQNKDWILFFDEADALFGKRTNVRDAHDKYANQEVAYLLQRIESFEGLVILASNFKSNIDEAFTRRFQSIIYFPKPGPAERFELWTNTFPEQVELEKKIDLRSIAQNFELTGANIVNIVQYACLMALSREQNMILLDDLKAGIRKELRKEGKID